MAGKWINDTKMFAYYADREFFGTHYVVLFKHRFVLPDVKIRT